MRQFQFEPTTFVSEKMKTILIFTLTMHISCLVYLPLLNSQYSVKILVNLPQIVYICMTTVFQNSIL